MMEKIKSRGRAKFKFLLILPVVCLLLLAFAEPKAAKESEKGGMDNVDEAMLSKEDSSGTFQTKEQEKTEEQKKILSHVIASPKGAKHSHLE